MGATQVDGRQAQRADAARNQADLLAAGRELLRQLGPAFPFTAVATRAGLGRGTLYRHFPAREDLVTAIVEENVAELVAELRSAGTGGDREVRRVLTVVARALVDGVELTQLLAIHGRTLGRARTEVVAALRGSLAPAAGRPVDDRTAALVLVMLAAAIVHAPADARQAAAQGAVDLLAAGLAAPVRTD